MNSRADYYDEDRPRTAAGGNGSRSPEELQADIERHRDNIDHTLLALENKLSPGELLDEGLRYLKSGPGEMLLNMGHAARDNPLPVALTGIGLAWLIFGQRQGAVASSSRAETERMEAARIEDLYAHYLSEEYPFEEDEIDCIIYEDLGPEAYDRYQSRGGRASLADKGAEWKARAGEALSGAGERASELSEQARAAAAEWREKTRSRVQSIQARMAAAGEETRERATRARDIAWRRARRTGAAAAAGARSAAHYAEDLFQRYPLSMVALGVAAGAALGTAIPETRREDELMGSASDRLKAQAREAVHHQGERVGRAAAAARDAAVAEAKAQGLSGEELSRQGHELREKAEEVAAAARSEAERQGLTAEAAREQVHKGREKVEAVASAAREAAEREGRQGG